MVKTEHLVSDVLALKADSDEMWGCFGSETCGAGKIMEETGELVVALTMTRENCGRVFESHQDFLQWRARRIYEEALDVANVALRVGGEFGRRNHGA